MWHNHRRHWLILIGAMVVILVGMVSVRMMQAGIRFPWDWLKPVIFSVIVLGIVWFAGLQRAGKTRWVLSRNGVLLTGLGIAVGIIYVISSSTAAAWGTTIFLFSLFLVLDEVLPSAFETPSRTSPESGSQTRSVVVRKLIIRWLIRIALASLCGGIVVILGQIESHFADEEFFVALQGLVLAGFWLLLGFGVFWLLHRFPRKLITEPDVVENNAAGKNRQLLLSFDSRWLTLIILLTTVLFSIVAVRAYEHSFFTTSAPSYPNISAATPFLCGLAAPDPQTYESQDVFNRLLMLIEANPSKAAPEYGILALGTGDSSWIKAFHDTLLEEASKGLFTGPTGSVKSTQLDAALRVFYYSRTLAAFPDTFTSAENTAIHNWFAAINRRALTVEPVDWLYALAFSMWPAGPYENQEIGAGLLSMLETTGLADPALSVRNRAYLASNQRGWEVRFRVTDDAAVYQPVWIDDAYFQFLFTGNAVPENIQHSFEWLLLQALPDGLPLKYNHVESAPLEGLSFLGSELTGNDHYLWLAGRTVDYLESHGLYAAAQPDLMAESDVIGHSPTEGSCLLYGDSGLPNQVGPLAPDKIVFRDGWTKDSAYLMLNLRFTGWHRYKATNDIVLVYQDGPLAVEELSGEIFQWLPVGRNLFRDKRIPRENLNGLVIARTGMSAAISSLTGIGGAWAQDPPYYASVENFATGPEVDTSTTRLSSWRGWTQQRTINFYHGGPIVIMDDAQGPDASPAALIWHFPEGSEVHGQRIQVRTGDHPAEVVLVPITGTIHSEDDGTSLQVQVQNSAQLSLVTVFLDGEWVGAKVSILGDRLIVNGPKQIELTIP